MNTYLIKNTTIVRPEGLIHADVLIKNSRFEKIGPNIEFAGAHTVIDGSGKFLFPGAIDDQVHFREPGLTHKGEIYTEAKAAVAGGITSYMEMPNTVPNALTQSLLEDKYRRAAEVSLANYSFFMGASNDNLEEVLKTDAKKVCGVKIFMGSSTGNMLVDNTATLEKIFSNSPMLIATHCEDEQTVRNNMALFKEKYGEQLKPEHHPQIRSEEACFLSSSRAVELAKKHGTRLHILHISTDKETWLFEAGPLANKKITSEACIHHLWFSQEDYASKGNFIKWNPAVKTKEDRAGILQALLDDRIDVIATDHAPHTLEEKNQAYAQAPSGGPLVQHALLAMLEMYHDKKVSLEFIAKKMCEAPAQLFAIEGRGAIREGLFADAVLINLNRPHEVTKESLLYKCQWSPFDGYTFKSAVEKTWVNGHLVYNEGKFDESQRGQRLSFNRI